jgi:hypothetical protein
MEKPLYAWLSPWSYVIGGIILLFYHADTAENYAALTEYHYLIILEMSAMNHILWLKPGFLFS